MRRFARVGFAVVLCGGLGLGSCAAVVASAVGASGANAVENLSVCDITTDAVATTNGRSR